MEDPWGPEITIAIFKKNATRGENEKARASRSAHPGRKEPTRGDLPGKPGTTFSGAVVQSEAIPKCFFIWEITHPGELEAHPGKDRIRRLPADFGT